MPGENIKAEISKILGETAVQTEPLHGGDINEVFLVKGEKKKAVLKTNTRVFPGMFPAEAAGLEALSKAGAFRIPEVLAVKEHYLLLEYIAPGSNQLVNGEELGRTLAKLHRHTALYYGFDGDNYIGSLPQRNQKHEKATDFYREERLLPQFRRAEKKGFTFRKLDAFLIKLDDIIPDEPASLIHGDLWGGNYMVSAQGEPCLIDPAVSYASREMDLAMMALFGGFPKNHTEAYREAFPLQPQWKERIPLWQLYYVLVHLNIFGAGYYSRCMQIIKTYI